MESGWELELYHNWNWGSMIGLTSSRSICTLYVWSHDMSGGVIVLQPCRASRL